MHKMKYVVTLLILFNMCCGYESSHQTSAVRNIQNAVNGEPSNGSASGSFPKVNGVIRDVDFYNFTYQWYPKWEYMLSEKKEFMLRNGKLEVDVPSGSNEPAAFELVTLQYGDVTGDNVEEAVITIKLDVMGNSKPYVVFVYSLINNEPKMLWVHEAGDRADKGLRKVYITDNHLLVMEEYNADKIVSSTEEETKVGMCCPKTFTRTFYRWQQSNFQKFREEIQPNEYKDAKVLIESTSVG